MRIAQLNSFIVVSFLLSFIFAISFQVVDMIYPSDLACKETFVGLFSWACILFLFSAVWAEIYRIAVEGV